MIVTMLGVTWKIRSWKTGKVPFRPLFVYKSQGPACVEVCPTQALRLVTPEHLENLNRQKQLASAEALLAMPARV